MKKRTFLFFIASWAALIGYQVNASPNFTIAPGIENFTAVSPGGINLLADLEGKWQFTMTPPERSPITGVLAVKRGSGPAGYVGSILINEMQQEASTKITKAEVTGEKFVYAGEVTLNASSYTFEMTGTIKGDKIEGQTRVQEPDGTVIYKLQATRQ